MTKDQDMVTKEGTGYLNTNHIPLCTLKISVNRSSKS